MILCHSYDILYMNRLLKDYRWYKERYDYLKMIWLLKEILENGDIGWYRSFCKGIPFRMPLIMANSTILGDIARFVRVPPLECRSLLILKVIS